MIITDSKNFGQAIRKRRKELGYTQTYISKFTGLSVSFISDLENGKKTVELDKTVKLANLLGLNIEIKPRG